MACSFALAISLSISIISLTRSFSSSLQLRAKGCLLQKQKLFPGEYRLMSTKRKLPAAEAVISGSDTVTSPSSKKQKERDYYERDSLTHPSISPEAKTLKILSWNIPGLRAAVKNHDAIISNLIKTQNADILCLQETKIQENHVGEFENYFNAFGYKGYWSCSTARKGYSGTVVLVKNNLVREDTVVTACSADHASTRKASKQSGKSTSIQSFFGKNAPLEINPPKEDAVRSDDVWIQSVMLDCQDSTFAGEGRLITLEFNSFYLVAAYVPNSGQTLDRLDYRVDGWDVYIRKYLSELKNASSLFDGKSKAVIYCGDMNVGHLDLDIYNYTAKHIPKQAGLTPRERASFSVLLESGFKDSFRHFYPTAKGQFTYWSQRTFARSVNCGLRLDYFICSENMFTQSEQSPVAQALDSYILHEETNGCSDHCPVVLIVGLSP